MSAPLKDQVVSPFAQQPSANQTDTNLNHKRKLDNENDTQAEPSAKILELDKSTQNQNQHEIFENLKKNLCLEKFKNLSQLSSLIQSSLIEQYFLEQNLTYLDFDKFKQFQFKNPIVQQFISENFAQKSTLNDLDTLCMKKFDLNQSLIKQKETSLLLTQKPSEQSKSIAERAKHEAQILQRITQLRKEGLWSIKRLPKLVEPTRTKTHWDYVLDEMVWMSTDFQQERKWKINTSKKISLSIQKYFKDKEQKSEVAEKEEQKRLRKQAQLVAKDVQQFWKQVEKIIEYKKKTLHEEKRKQQLDKHLNFIVDQTEKYSSWLMESLNNSSGNANADLSRSESKGSKGSKDDEEYEEDEEVEDNESTIESEDDAGNNDEIEKLKMESELNLDDLLKDYNLDENYFKLDQQDEAMSINDEEEEDDEEESVSDEDVCSDDMSEEEDDEETIEQDENMMSCDYDAEKELEELRADSSLPIEQLLGNLYTLNILTCLTRHIL